MKATVCHSNVLHSCDSPDLECVGAAAPDSRAPATAKAKPVAPTAPGVPGETAKERAMRVGPSVHELWVQDYTCLRVDCRAAALCGGSHSEGVAWSAINATANAPLLTCGPASRPCSCWRQSELRQAVARPPPQQPLQQCGGRRAQQLPRRQPPPRSRPIQKRHLQPGPPAARVAPLHVTAQLTGRAAAPAGRPTPLLTRNRTCGSAPSRLSRCCSSFTACQLENCGDELPCVLPCPCACSSLVRRTLQPQYSWWDAQRFRVVTTPAMLFCSPHWFCM